MDKKIQASKSFQSAFQISVAYLLFGMVWIYFSDRFIGFLTNDSHQILIWQTYKGFFFIGVTAFLLYLLSHKILRDRHAEYEQHLQEQKKAQLQLSQQDALLKTIINSSPDAIFVKDLEGKYLLFNDGAGEIIGLSPEKVIGKSDDLIFSMEVANRLQEVDRLIVSERKIVNQEEYLTIINGIEKTFWSTKGPLFTDEGKIYGLFGISRDITTIKDNEKIILNEKERYDYMAHHDPLTGLPNRLSLIETLQIKTDNRENHPFALFFIDLDGFKEINDSYGHRFGDEILILFAKLLQDLFFKDTLIIRTGGDEFVILIESPIDHHSLQIQISHLIQMLNDPFIIDQIEVFITASIGISFYPEDSSNAEELLQKADAAMYKAKNQGRNTYNFYNDGLTQEVLERTTIASNLKKAISNRDLILYYQLQINPHSGKVIGAEALTRWFTEEETIPPSIFIPIAEERGLIIELGSFVLEEGFKTAVDWMEKGIFSGRIAINVSAKQLIHQNFLLQLKELLHKTECNPAWIELEITESSILEYPEKMIALLGVIKSMGFKISIDDFGTGYSSLSYLRHLPIDKLKIDISFIRNITIEPKNQTIVKTIIALAKGLGMEVLAEGVESIEEMEFLLENGIDSIQGYYYYKPMDIKDVELLFKASTGYNKNNNE
jgi:diguanylate cyclase (GGDEF)-like protein/PAS domain S-box-containing protein